jgi:integrase
MKRDINHELLQNLPIPPDGTRKLEVVAASKRYQGLYLEIYRGGNVTWRFRYKSRITGKTTHIRIGALEEVPLEVALAKAAEYRAQLNSGAEPAAAVRSKPKMPTLTRFFEDRYLSYARSRKRGAKKEQQIFDYRLKAEFGDLRLDQITRAHVQNYLTQLVEVEKLSNASANHHAKLLRHVLNCAVEWSVLESNPVAKVKLLPVQNQTERYMNEEQLGRLLTVLATYPARNACRVALFLLSTGARLSEALNAKWENIDREHRLWRIPAADAKSKKVRACPLNDSALEVLDQLGSEGKHEYLFVKDDGDRFRSMYPTWYRIRKKAGLPWLRLHDLRHQYASMLVNSGRTLYEVQLILGHSNPLVTTRYAHLSTAALQDAASQASKVISGARDRAA